MTHLKIGDKAPYFEGNNQNGKLVTLDDFQGHKLVVYFYPKDNTPGCTNQACNLRDNFSELRAQNYQIVGISADSVKSHKRFEQKYKLPFTLIADENKKIIHDYGVWGEKKFMGRKFQGIHRITFLIDKDGNIEKIIDRVKTKNHTEQILSQD